MPDTPAQQPTRFFAPLPLPPLPPTPEAAAEAAAQRIIATVREARANGK
jgi:hypothetical protein